MSNPTEDPPRVTVSFDDAETGAIYQFAEWFAARCLERGMKPPPDPMRSLLFGAFMLHQRVAFLERILLENEIDAGDYAPPPDTLQ